MGPSALDNRERPFVAGAIPVSFLRKSSTGLRPSILSSCGVLNDGDSFTLIYGRGP